MSANRFKPLDHPGLLLGAAVGLQVHQQRKEQAQNPAYYLAMQNDPLLKQDRYAVRRSTRTVLLAAAVYLGIAAGIAAMGFHFDHHRTASLSHLLIVLFLVWCVLPLVAAVFMRSTPHKLRKRAGAAFRERWLEAGLQAPASGLVASYLRGQALSQTSQLEFMQEQEAMYVRYFQHHYGFTPTAEQPAPSPATSSANPAALVNVR